MILLLLLNIDRMNYVVAVLVLLGVAGALIGFDCSGDRLNVIISLNSIGECGTAIEPARTGEVYVQLLQLTEFNQVSVNAKSK